MNIAILGVGYVGLVTGACLAKLGNRVICADVDRTKIDCLEKGVMPIYEPGLEEMVAIGAREKSLAFSSDVSGTIRDSELIFICVGTPSDENGAADLTYIRAAAKDMATSLNSYKLVINKSTVPVGSTRLVEQIIRENAPVLHEFDVISNPEFLREGSAIDDFMRPDRIVIGTTSSKAIRLMTELYRPINAPLLVTDPASAEMIKYASNAFLATKVSYINAIANICEAVGADVKEVALGMGYDHRIGFEFLKAGPGWGGSCFPKDCKALVRIAEDSGYDFELLKGAIDVNQEQQSLMVSKLEKLVGDLEGKTIGALGLAFKPNTDDVRDSPAMIIIRKLLEARALVRAYDPVAMNNAKRLLPQLVICSDPYAVANESDALLVLTEWDEFKWLDFDKIKTLLKNPIIVDTRNCLDPKLLRQMGFTYEGVGR
jgi:UDPglucose 6-dehydrogenase